MRNPNMARFVLVGTFVLVLGLSLSFLNAPLVVAQQAVDTPTAEPASPTPTTVQPTATTGPNPTATTGPNPTATTPVQPPAPSQGPVPIPEPITVVLFGTGLAALSAAAAARRKKGE
jgi:PEP-CTERM motif